MNAARENKRRISIILTITTPVSSPGILQPRMSSDKKTSDQPNESSSSEIDISVLASLIASTTITSNGDKTGDSRTAEGEEVEELGANEAEELLRRLEAVTGIAVGVEDKLNQILKQLDGLLSSLEEIGEKKQSGGPADPQPDR